MTDAVTEILFSHTYTSSARLALILGTLSTLSRSKLFSSVEASMYSDITAVLLKIQVVWDVAL